MQNQNQLLMGVLSYIGPLVIIPFISAKNDPFVNFHIKQGVVLVAIEIALWILMKIMWSLIPIIGLLQLGVTILSIIGIINVVQKQEKALPLVGSFSKYVKI